MIYTVIVGNIGQVYQGDSEVDAKEIYEAYVARSQDGWGRAAGEDVVMLGGELIMHEYFGTINRTAR